MPLILDGTSLANALTLMTIVDLTLKRLDRLELVTPRLLLRQWRDDDVEPLVALNADPEVSRYLGGTITRAESEAMAARMRVHWATGRV
jgi:RimJ/RimL family protein N-acetyltransferase